MSRDKANLDVFWLRDESLEGSEDLQPPVVIAAEIAENLEAALEQFAEIHEVLRALAEGLDSEEVVQKLRINVEDERNHVASTSTSSGHIRAFRPSLSRLATGL